MSPSKPNIPFLPKLLWFVMALFIGILVFVYVVTRNTTVVMLDEQGRQHESSSSTENHR